MDIKVSLGAFSPFGQPNTTGARSGINAANHGLLHYGLSEIATFNLAFLLE